MGNDLLLGYEDLGYEDMMGDDDLGLDDLLGAVRARRGGARGRGLARANVRRLAPGGPRVLSRPPLIAPAPGVGQTSGLYLPLGLGSFNFTAAAAVTANTFQENPQKPVRPRRLWISIARSAGAVGIGVVVSDIKIGTKSMLAGLQPIPAEQFAPGAFAQSYSMFDSATPGINVAVFVNISALPGAGENVFVSVSMDCDSLG